jgi:hypothetical protein
MNTQEVLDKGADLLEPQVKAYIEKNSDKIVELFVEKLKQLIPGHYEDAPLALAMPKLKEMGKEEMLKLADKISPRV